MTKNNGNELVQVFDFTKWRGIDYHWSGDVALNQLKRVASETLNDAEHSVRLSFDITKADDVFYFSFEVQGDLSFACTRCLQPVRLPLQHQQKIAILADANLESVLGEDDDFIVLDNDDETLTMKRFDIFQLIEDEIFLILPLSPKHEDCEVEVDQVGPTLETDTDNPFAALSSLKGKL